jgi:hypothetical protein
MLRIVSLAAGPQKFFVAVNTSPTPASTANVLVQFAPGAETPLAMHKKKVRTFTMVGEEVWFIDKQFDMCKLGAPKDRPSAEIGKAITLTAAKPVLSEEQDSAMAVETSTISETSTVLPSLKDSKSHDLPSLADVFDSALVY